MTSAATVAATTNADAKRPSNSEVLRAIVFTADGPIRESVEKGDGKSKAMPSDPFSGMYGHGRVIGPPIELYALATMEENSAELGKCITAYEINIEGFGGRLLNREMPKDTLAKHKEEVEVQRRKLTDLLERPNPDDTFTQLRRKLRRDREATGNAYLELVLASDHVSVASMKHIESHTMRITKEDDDATLMTTRIVDPVTGESRDRLFYKRFRRFVQERHGKQVFFKEWGDPRIVDMTTGLAYKDEAAATVAKLEKSNWANPVKHFRIYCAHSPYGLPRYIGNLFSAYGSRASEEINFKTLKNNAIPNMVVMVSGGAMLTEGTIQRIQEFVNSQIKQTDNYSKILLLEAEAKDELAAAGGSTAKIEMKPLKDAQHSDELFQNYDKNNRDKIRECFRLPPLLIGRSEGTNKSTSEAARKLAEEQVFAPERAESDADFAQLFLDMGLHFWVYRSFSPIVTDSKDLVDVLSSTEKAGGITPNLARQILEEILNRPVPQYDKDSTPFDPDVPFSLTMAEAVKSIAAARGDAAASLGGNPSTGVLAPNQGQIPGLGGDAGEDWSPENVTKIVDKFDSMLDQLSGYQAKKKQRRAEDDEAGQTSPGSGVPEGG